MGAPIGNEFWKLGDQKGRPRLYKNLEDLTQPVTEWMEKVSNKKLTVQVATSKGVLDINKPIPMTIYGLCRHLGIAFDTWKKYKEREEFVDFITRVEELIYDQKFTYAAIGEFKDNLIARDLGIADKQNISGIQQVVIESENTDDHKAFKDTLEND